MSSSDLPPAPESRPDRWRVVYLDHCARLSGAEIALARVLPALTDRVEPIVLLGEDGPLVRRLHDDDIDVRLLPMPAGVREVRKEGVTPGRVGPRTVLPLLAYVVRLARELRTLEPDLVHTNSLKAALYGGLAGRLARVPVVWHIRDRIAADYLPRPAVQLVRLLARVLPRAVVANSSSTLATLPATAPRARGFDPVVRDSVPPPGRQPHAAARTPRTALRFGVVGRLAPWKGQHVFLEAFARAFAGGPTQAWLIGSAMFGEHDYERQLRTQVERLGLSDQVVFRGFREDVWCELAELDVLVHCSVTAEPFGQVVVEGMAAGLPVLASAEGGPAEIITDGVDGLLVAPRDAAALADALRTVASDEQLRRRLGERARVTAREYSPEATADQLIAVYAATLGAPARVGTATEQG
jgi:glycosyltransferase involved in cell wall biosynthesis